ncbi:DNA-binding proteins Bright/BRCAA1/RBP1 and proteins containing BRIGHT domain [Lecanora helva]
MAPTSTNINSSIAMAFAGRTESVDIPKPRDNFWIGKESFAAVAAKSLPNNKLTAGLPTPPNSLSPSLPPQAYKARNSAGPLTPPGPVQVDSDIDLEDAVDHAKTQDSPQRGLTARGLGELADSDVAGNITPALLAKHHLPGILLENGPLAIRHVMGYLTTSVPGYAGIPPAKARRLVVGALEGRGSEGAQGGIDGDVIFEKVGWGRWGARRRGQTAREARSSRQQATHPSATHRIQVTSTRRDYSQERAFSHASDRDYDTPMDETHGFEHEADRMSLDGDEDSPPACKTRDQRKIITEDLDMTDEEDWASIGAAALRQGSFPLSGGMMPTNQRYAPHRDPRSRRRAAGRTSSTMAYSVPVTKTLMSNKKTQQQQDAARVLMGFSPLPENGFSGDAQDREAVEALLKLSSV